MCPFDGNPTTYPTPVIPAQAPDKDAEILLRAAAIIRQRGHLSGTMNTRGPNGEVCIGCAISLAKNGGGGRGFDAPYLNGIASRLGFRSAGHMAIWNIRATEVQVIARLREAAHAR